MISFDWAMKKLLRSKANFEILEGFLSELLKDSIHILEILESEGNKEDRRDKFNCQDTLELSENQQALYNTKKIYQIFPEYYLIKVNNFDGIANDTFDEWIYFLKNEEIKENFKAKGLIKAKQELDILKLPEQERLAYEKYQDDLHYQASMVESSYTIGKLKEKRKISVNLLKAGLLDTQTIADMTGLTLEEVEALQREIFPD